MKCEWNRCLRGDPRSRGTKSDEAPLAEPGTVPAKDSGSLSLRKPFLTTPRGCEATAFVTNFAGYYLRVQSEVDHVQPDNGHAIALVNRATDTRHSGLGRCVWTRVNSASGVTTNVPNQTYLPPDEPEWIVEGIPSNL